jgi:hypothetical protein
VSAISSIRLLTDFFKGNKLHFKSPLIRQRRKEGTFSASELVGIEPTPPAPKGAGYVRLDHSATVGIFLSFSHFEI